MKRLLPVIIAAAAAAAFAAVNAGLRAPLIETAKERVGEASSRALTKAVSEVMESADTNALMNIRSTGEETYVITVDTARLNAISASITELAQELICDCGQMGVGVELGTVSGVTLLTGCGPSVKVRFTPMGSVTPKVGSNLVSSGINQSLFAVELTLTARIKLLIAGKSEEITVKNTVPICETVVVGQVPQVYTNVANEDDMLNLIPTDLP